MDSSAAKRHAFAQRAQLDRHRRQPIDAGTGAGRGGRTRTVRCRRPGQAGSAQLFRRASFHREKCEEVTADPRRHLASTQDHRGESNGSRRRGPLPGD